jgi:hypothetical protein
MTLKSWQLSIGAARNAGSPARCGVRQRRWLRGREIHVRPILIIEAYVKAGDKAHALEWIENAFEERDPSLFNIAYPTLDSLRSEPRFRDLLLRMNLPE